MIYMPANDSDGPICSLCYPRSTGTLYLHLFVECTVFFFFITVCTTTLFSLPFMLQLSAEISLTELHRCCMEMGDTSSRPTVCIQWSTPLIWVSGQSGQKKHSKYSQTGSPLVPESLHYSYEVPPLLPRTLFDPWVPEPKLQVRMMEATELMGTFSAVSQSSVWAWPWLSSALWDLI